MLMGHNVCPDGVFDWTTPQLKQQIIVPDTEAETDETGNVNEQAEEGV